VTSSTATMHLASQNTHTATKSWQSTPAYEASSSAAGPGC